MNNLDGVYYSFIIHIIIIIIHIIIIIIHIIIIIIHIIIYNLDGEPLPETVLRHRRGGTRTGRASPRLRRCPSEARSSSPASRCLFFVYKIAAAAAAAAAAIRCKRPLNGLPARPLACARAYAHACPGSCCCGYKWCRC